MSLLTDDECREIYNGAMAMPERSIVSAMRVIEAAVLAKLATDVGMEPVAYIVNYTVPVNIGVPGDAVYEKRSVPSLIKKTDSDPLYTSEQIRAAYAAGAAGRLAAERERCAAVCDALSAKAGRIRDATGSLEGDTGYECADAIRVA